MTPNKDFLPPQQPRKALEKQRIWAEKTRKNKEFPWLEKTKENQNTKECKIRASWGPTKNIPERVREVVRTFSRKKTRNSKEPLNAPFLMGCFPGKFKRENGPVRHWGRRPIKVGQRPIKEGKRPVNTNGQWECKQIRKISEQIGLSSPIQRCCLGLPANMPKTAQDMFAHYKGQKSAISGHRLH